MMITYIGKYKAISEAHNKQDEIQMFFIYKVRKIGMCRLAPVKGLTDLSVCDVQSKIISTHCRQALTCIQKRIV